MSLATLEQREGFTVARTLYLVESVRGSPSDTGLVSAFSPMTFAP
jgi:hypothetical protein